MTEPVPSQEFSERPAPPAAVRFVRRHKVVLVRAAFSKVVLANIPKHLPLALLALAGSLEGRHEPVLVDRAVKKDDHLLARILGDREVTCVGISVHTGPGLMDALHCSRLVKRLRPDVTVVWGGWHATKAPASILREPSSDFVI
ncbi:MAG: cobalamin B12-binding domain-containing protein [Proteobacteria bacterium]|nr:cobalamin B12-binding domain-containing protein [Pseudomonadota bacterium]